MILYQIFTDGEMNFSHIHEWSPHFEDRIDSHQIIEHLPSPRIFKSHLDYGTIPKGPCKYIYVVRNGKDVAISYFHYYQTHLGYRKSFEQFFEYFLKGKLNYGSWFEHVGQWLENRHNLSVLFLTYEELTCNKEGVIRKIIDFCGSQVGPKEFNRIMERSSFAFMKQHEDKLDQLTWVLMERQFKTGAFIRKAQVGEWKEHLSSDQEELFHHKFTGHLGKLSDELKSIIG